MLWRTLEAFAAEDPHSPHESCSLTAATVEDSTVSLHTHPGNQLRKGNRQLLAAVVTNSHHHCTAFGEGDAAVPARSQELLLLNRPRTTADGPLQHHAHP